MTDNEKYVLVEHQSLINSIIINTFQSTQRIKFTAFDVSTKYIIFGVNSGGIYIFNREPCQFLKLIPSTHGPAILIAISEDNESLAIATASGLVIVLEDCFTEFTFQQEISKEHEGNTVTALKWNRNDLYCGDSKGKVSVITLKNFLTKAIFQTPIACLMNLDSHIIQIDACAKFLLVSTSTRTLLCDTETERFRQIGKKLRDGPFGACFFNTFEEPWIFNTGPQTRGIFQRITDNEQLSNTEISEALKIYCARPGARLWQANFLADVVFTLQFKQSLDMQQSEIIKLYDDSNAEEDYNVKALESFNFNKIYRFINKFIMSFRDDGFYIFDPTSSSLKFWSSTFKNIKDIKILNSSLYIWYNDLDIKIISLISIEDLIIQVLLKKDYNRCADLCIKFLPDIESLLESSNKIHLISVLESKLPNESPQFKKLEPIFASLKERNKNPSLDRIKNGIVTISNIYTEAVNIPEFIEKFGSSDNAAKAKDVYDILQEQYKLSQMYETIETTDYKSLLSSNDLNTIYRFLREFTERNIDDKLGCENWCKRTFLKYLNTVSESIDFDDLELDIDTLDFALEAFINMNSSPDNVCSKCYFPLPHAKNHSPRYYSAGVMLLEKIEDVDKLLKNVPYMYKSLLEKISDLDDVKLKLPLLIQFSDRDIIKNIPIKLPYDIWDESLQLLLKLKNDKKCLNCNDQIDITSIMELKDFALIIIDSINAVNTLKLLKRYSNLLPDGVLDEFFYQYCVFSNVSKKTNPAICKVLSDDAITQQFDRSVSAFLHKKYVDKVNYDDGSPLKITPPSELSSTCDYCQLPLDIPIIEGICRLECGHSYHQLCFMYIKSKCKFCQSDFLK